MADYPNRPRFFAFRFCRLLAKQAVAHDIGSDACWLLATIAMMEDAKGYKAPVTWFNDGLASVMGGSEDSLGRVRKKAVDAGWLHYEPGVRKRAGRYWVIIPPQFCGGNDEEELPIGDEIPPQNCGGNENETSAYSRTQPRGMCGGNREECAEECADPSTLSLSLSLSRNPNTSGEVSPETPLVRPKADAAGGNGKPDGDIPKGLKRLIEVWNQIDGIQPCRLPTRKRVSAFRQRERTAGWMESVKPALDKLRESDFCHGTNDRGWLANLDWFLRPDTVAKLIEGTYDNREPVVKVKDPLEGIPFLTEEPKR